MKAKVYTIKGETKEDIVLPKEYGEKFSKALLKQAIRVYEDGTHFGLARVKTRHEVNKTRKKLYKQKGTGGARHGAKSAPIFVGGGVAHGPKGVKRVLRFTSKMKKKALLASLANKFESKGAVLVTGMEKIEKTSDGAKMIFALKKSLKIKSKVLIVLSKKNMKLTRFYKNIKDTEVICFDSLNPFLVMRKSLILIESNIFKKK
ncbi:MAG: uL4 family ribosomal protein [Candidatus Woesebacteria bacterium]|nr:uL4 family ribosomal protein [Candidatus Woesebacteria bacterium]